MDAAGAAVGVDTGDAVAAVAVIGSGSIGVAWATVFAGAGRAVRIFEIDPARRALVPAEVTVILSGLEVAGVLEGSAAQAAARITVWSTLAEAVEGVGYVQECIGEDVEAKRRMFADLDRITGRDVVLASSSSTIETSRFAVGLPGCERCLVVHPGNPPFFLRVAEVVPAPFTSERATRVASALLEGCGIAPILINEEIEGFVFNRLQGALLREAYCLVRDGIVSPVDLDTIVREGLGLRWSLIGPFATSELNTRGGLRRHAEVLGPVYARMGLERGADDPWSPETVELVAASIENALPYGSWDENVRARDAAMMELVAVRPGAANPLASGRHIVGA
ncbi:3-hydroxyacyl-CoA dehydrogenase [Microbacterium sp. 1P10UB]|uniref:3-hydroxyacyl-CoA dehydrogenase n=1 Tax=unclassified Microbacterium TaxID=2609290 RepID=UPI0039A35AC7